MNKNILTIIFLVFTILFSYSQIDTLKVRGEKTTTHDVCKKVDVQAKFNGDWNKYLIKSLNEKLKNYTPVKNERINVRFVVCTDGKICNVVALNGDEVLRKITEDAIIESKDWIPAKLEGKEVKAYRTQPILFLAENDKILKVDKERIYYAQKINEKEYRIISREGNKQIEYHFNIDTGLKKSGKIKDINNEIKKYHNLLYKIGSVLIGVGKINGLFYEVEQESIPNSKGQTLIKTYRYENEVRILDNEFKNESDFYNTPYVQLTNLPK